MSTSARLTFPGLPAAAEPACQLCCPNPLQAADQFKLFTGKDAPVDLMRTVVLDSLAK